ncbi:T7SS effector LXG polymorphic toxin [Rossellomorea marisflavi]|nr:T7SS effector LXG polymorphic toxin [Rossellomorea marisflavi]
MKILDVDGFQKGIKEIEETLSSQKKQADQVAKAIQGFTDLDEAFKGKGGNAIRDFYRNMHLPFLEQYQSYLSGYQSVIKSMNNALQNLEPAPDGFMNEGFLENELQAGLHFAKQTTVHLTFEANETIKNVSDIVTLPKIEDETCMQYVAEAEREMSHSIEKVYEFDHAQTASLSSLQGQVDALEKQIMQLSPIFKKLDFNPVLLPTKRFEGNETDWKSFAIDFSKEILSGMVTDLFATAEGFTLAILDILIGIIDSLIFLFTDPFGFFGGILHALLHPIDTLKYMGESFWESVEKEVIEGDQRSRTRFEAYVATYVATSLVGIKGADKVSTVSKASKAGKAGKKSSNQDIPYKVMNTAKVRAAIHDGVKYVYGQEEKMAQQLLFSKTGKQVMDLKAISGSLGEFIGNTKNVLNPEKLNKIMEKTYQKVASGPVSKAVNSEAYSTFKKLVMNENGHVRFSWKTGDSKKETKGEVSNKSEKVIESIDVAREQQRVVIDSVEDGEITLETTKQKGNYGEIKMDDFFENQTYTRISDDRVLTLDQKINKGIDGVYENATPPPKYVIAEAKYNKAQLSNTKDGLQMSEDWILGSNRLEDAVGQELAEMIRDEMILNPENVQSLLIRIDENGNVTKSTLNSFGKIDK